MKKNHFKMKVNNFSNNIKINKINYKVFDLFFLDNK